MKLIERLEGIGKDRLGAIIEVFMKISPFTTTTPPFQSGARDCVGPTKSFTFNYCDLNDNH